MGIYLVTGGAGFVGSHIAEKLVREGQSVRVIDNLHTGRMENLSSIKDNIDFFQGDIRDIDTCRRQMEGVSHVFHLAALTSVAGSVRNPAETSEVNILGTVNILTAARDAGVDCFLFSSSAAVYGDDPDLPKKEAMEGSFLSPYGISKLSAEKYCLAFYNMFELPTVCLRYFNIYGPRQDPRSDYASVVPSFIARTINDEDPIVFGDGEQTRDFIFISDVVDANLLAVENNGSRGKVFNIARGEQTSVNELIDGIKDILGLDIDAKYEEPRLGDIRHSVADISRAEVEIGFSPEVALRSGLEKTISWFRDQLDK